MSCTHISGYPEDYRQVTRLGAWRVCPGSSAKPDGGSRFSGGAWATRPQDRLSVFCESCLSVCVGLGAVRGGFDEVVAAHGRQPRRRDSRLPAHVMVYFALALGLWSGHDCEQVMAQLRDRWGPGRGRPTGPSLGRDHGSPSPAGVRRCWRVCTSGGRSQSRKSSPRGLGRDVTAGGCGQHRGRLARHPRQDAYSGRPAGTAMPVPLGTREERRGPRVWSYALTPSTRRDSNTFCARRSCTRSIGAMFEIDSALPRCCGASISSASPTPTFRAAIPASRSAVHGRRGRRPCMAGSSTRGARTADG
ncbi:MULTISPECIES: transposase domain-containing protein [Streptomyces]|uniref:transposase domain-containing protein n=1 Tax=Streptomyces TaxID=1883 RepID=UPI0036A8BF94